MGIVRNLLNRILAAASEIAPRTNNHIKPNISAQQDWKDGSGVKSTGFSFRNPEFSSQHVHGSSHLSVTLVPRLLTP